MGFIILLILVRVIGNKQLGQLNVFSYISGIAIGSMVADIILHRDIKFWPSMLGVALWVTLAICVELLSMKSVKARELLDGQPIILIKKGKILWKALKEERLNIDDLTMMLRTNNVFSILDVDYAILESNGDLSVLKKELKEGVTREDMNITLKNSAYIPTTVISDGKVIMKNLKELGLGEEWLRSALKDLDVKKVSDVLYGEIQEDGRLYIQTKM
jgi:uncharacterized membrane protein YcaP (DUF421 family)